MIRKILLIDDDTLVNFIHSKILETELPGIPVTIFKNGLQALEFIAEYSTIPYLVFLDINMPVMNAWEFLEALLEQKENYDLQIYILTSSVDNGDKVKAYQYKQVHSFLHKPLSRTQLTGIKKKFNKL